MYQTNYFQTTTLKSILLIFVSAMLLVIPNLHVYSPIGSYQTLSPGLLANANSHNKKYLHIRCPDKGWHYSIYDYFEHGYVDAIPASVMDGTCGDDLLLSFKTKNYAKYDFSGFDN